MSDVLAIVYGRDKIDLRRTLRLYVAVLLLAIVICSCKKKVAKEEGPIREPKDKTFVLVDASKTEGVINRDLIGVNQGPYATYTSYEGYNGTNAVDLSKYYAEAGFTSARLDEYGRIDFADIFPDFTADPYDPASYVFTMADEYIRSIVDLDMEVVFRMGYGDGHKRHVSSADQDKWSEVMLQVIKHYNEGWANGYHWNIQYWEIWNEPGGHGWDGTAEEYFELYKKIALKIKTYDPALKVGGPSLGGPSASYDREFAKAFIQYCSVNDLPLDFFSYHFYFTNPKANLEHTSHHRQFLDAHGYAGTKLFLTEWGWLSGKNYPPTKEEVTSMEDASADAAALITLQGNVDMAHFYIGGAFGCCTWGLFDFFQSAAGKMSAEPRRSFFAFKAFYQLSEAKNKLKSSASKDVYVLSGIDDEKKKINVMLSTYDTRVDGVDLRVMNVPWDGETGCVIYVIDDNNKLKEAGRSIGKTEKGIFIKNDVHISIPSVCLIMLEKK